MSSGLFGSTGIRDFIFGRQENGSENVNENRESQEEKKGNESGDDDVDDGERQLQSLSKDNLVHPPVTTDNVEINAAKESGEENHKSSKMQLEPEGDSASPMPSKGLFQEESSDSEAEIRDPPAKTIKNMETRHQAFDVGYDSDGDGPPPNKTAEEEKQLENETPLGEEPPVTNKEASLPPSEVEEECPPNAPVDIPTSVLESKSFTVANIKEELRIRNVTYPSRFKREELLDRLKASLHLPVVALKGHLLKKKPQEKKEKKDDMSEFAPGAYWKVLKPKDAAVEEPSNPTFNSARSPTTPEEDALKPQVVKHNFPDTFKRPEYTGKRHMPKLNETTGKPVIGQDGKVVFEEVPRTKGGPKLSFLQQHNLTKDSHPVEFLEAFFPTKSNPYKNKDNHQYLSVAQCQQWTNMKALLANAGTDDCYVDFKPFTVKEIDQHLGLLILNGLSPSPNVDLKFDRSDVANYNYFVDTCMPNGLRRHRHFRAFFAVQDPRKATPLRRNMPLFKLLPLINWINKVGQVSWDLSINVSIDEQTISFQGRHYQKLRITYKAEGDGFQCDALCDRGFTHSVYFRNEKPPRKYTKMGLSPLHARVMWLFDKIEEKFTQVWMDNLYISAKFAKFSWNHPMRVKVSGAARKNGRGIPLSVIQEEKKDKKDATRVRGTVKASVLVGDKDMPDLVAVSVYDTKPVHFISSICTCIEWVLKTKEVWNEQQQKMDKVKFLRLNMNDDYNNDMNAVDISDQLRNNYRFDHWLRNFKWWWAILLWGYGTLLVNAYVYYTSVMDMFGVPKRLRFTHYQFRLAIARIKIDPNGDEVLRRWKESRIGGTVNVPNQQKTSGNKRSRSTSPVRSPAPTTPSVSSLSNDFGSVGSYGCSSVSVCQSVASSDSKKSPRIDDNTLMPDGKLKGRLDFFGCRRHLPISRLVAGKSKETKCALHRWACGRDRELRTNVMVCSDCLVPLCVDCYSVFHTEKDLVGQKQQLARKMMEEGELKREIQNNRTPQKTPQRKKRKTSPQQTQRPATRKTPNKQTPKRTTRRR